MILRVDVFLAIASKRDQRDYTDDPIPEDVVRRILDAGRLSGSSQNKQRWEFVLVETAHQELAETVYEPRNVLGAKLVVAICGARNPSRRSASSVGRLRATQCPPVPYPL